MTTSNPRYISRPLLFSKNESPFFTTRSCCELFIHPLSSLFSTPILYPVVSNLFSRHALLLLPFLLSSPLTAFATSPPPPSHTPYTMTTEQNIAYQHFHTALESLAEYKPRYQHQQKNDHPSHMYLSNKLSSHTIPSASAFGDEHLPYSPYYSFGISNNSCASSFTSISSSTSIASSDDFDPLPELRAFGKKAMKREKSSSKKMTCTMDPSLENPNDMIAYSENIESKR